MNKDDYKTARVRKLLLFSGVVLFARTWWRRCSVPTRLTVSATVIKPMWRRQEPAWVTTRGHTVTRTRSSRVTGRHNVSSLHFLRALCSQPTYNATIQLLSACLVCRGCSCRLYLDSPSMFFFSCLLTIGLTVCAVLSQCCWYIVYR